MPLNAIVFEVGLYVAVVVVNESVPCVACAIVKLTGARVIV